MIPTVIGDVDTRAVEQLQRCMDASEDCVGGAICADGHVGYSQPIGAAIAYEEHISVSGVGYDIGCGNKAVRTNLKVWDLNELRTKTKSGIANVMDEIERRISFGLDRPLNSEPVDHPVLDEIRRADFEPQRALADSAAKQLGTVGSGNHYVDLFEDDEGWVWVGVHFGSRGFGHKTASGFLAMAQGKPFDDKVPNGEMDGPPVLFNVNSNIGTDYLHAMKLAGRYAEAGRDVVCQKVLEILGTQASYSVHNHHNFAWYENGAWVIRKGCTPAFPGQQGFVGATMGESSVILEGCHANSDLQCKLLYSTVHGAGRAMSRVKAAGKIKRRKYWLCGERDCPYEVNRGEDAAKGCPDHPDAKMHRRFRTEQVRKGVVDWDAVTSGLVASGIELRGGAADEAPEAYKRLNKVLYHHRGTVNILHNLYPLGVCMAGSDTYDPFKDHVRLRDETTSLHPHPRAAGGAEPASLGGASREGKSRA